MAGCISLRADPLLMLTKTAGTTNWSAAHERAGIDDTHAIVAAGDTHRSCVSEGEADICAAWDAPTALRGPAAAELGGAKLASPPACFAAQLLQRPSSRRAFVYRHHIPAVDLVIGHHDGPRDGGVDEGDKSEAARLSGGAVPHDVRIRHLRKRRQPSALSGEAQRGCGAASAHLPKVVLEVGLDGILGAIVVQPSQEHLPIGDLLAALAALGVGGARHIEGDT